MKKSELRKLAFLGRSYDLRTGEITEGYDLDTPEGEGELLLRLFQEGLFHHRILGKRLPGSCRTRRLRKKRVFSIINYFAQRVIRP